MKAILPLLPPQVVGSVPAPIAKPGIGFTDTEAEAVALVAPLVAVTVTTKVVFVVTEGVLNASTALVPVPEIPAGLLLQA